MVMYIKDTKARHMFGRFICDVPVYMVNVFIVYILKDRNDAVMNAAHAVRDCSNICQMSVSALLSYVGMMHHLKPLFCY